MYALRLLRAQSNSRLCTLRVQPGHTVLRPVLPVASSNIIYRRFSSQHEDEDVEQDTYSNRRYGGDSSRSRGNQSYSRRGNGDRGNSSSRTRGGSKRVYQEEKEGNIIIRHYPRGRDGEGATITQKYVKQGGKLVSLTPNGEPVTVLESVIWDQVDMASPPTDTEEAQLQLSVKSEEEKDTQSTVDGSVVDAEVETEIDMTNDSEILANAPPRIAWFHYLSMSDDKKKALTSHDYNKLLGNLKRGLPSDRLGQMKKVFNDARNAEKAEVSAYNSVMNVLVRDDRLDEAHALMKEMKEKKIVPNLVTYNIMLFGLARAKRLNTALALFEELRSSPTLEPDVYTYATIIGMYCRLNNLAEAENVIISMQTSGIPLNSYIEELMLHGYLANNKIKHAHAVLRLLEKRAKDEAEKAAAGELPPDQKPYQLSAKLYNFMFKFEHRRAGQSTYLQSLYERMLKNGVRPTPETYQFMGYSPVEGFKMMLKNDLKPKIEEFNVFLNTAIKNNDFEQAAQLVRTLSEVPNMKLDAASYAILMDVHAKTGNIDAAFGLLDDMRAGGTEPDTIVYTSLLETCARAKDYDRAEEVFTTMKNSETGVAKPTTFSYNVLLNMYAEADNAQRVEELFTEMEPAGAIPDNRTYNILIAFHTKHQDLENAWRRYQQMREAGIHGDEHTYQLMEPLLTTHNIEHAEALFADVQKNPLTRGTNTVSMMANSLMLCYESLNKDEKILEVWHELRRLPVQPRQQSIVSVMHACTRLGLWETADTIWADVSASFNIHMYTCMAYCKVLIAQQRWDEIKPQFQKLESIFIDEALVNFLSELDQMKQHELAQEIRTLVEKHNEKAKKGNEKVRKGNERTRKAFKPR